MADEEVKCDESRLYEFMEKLGDVGERPEELDKKQEACHQSVRLVAGFFGPHDIRIFAEHRCYCWLSWRILGQ